MPKEVRILKEEDYNGEFNLRVMEKIYIKFALKKHKGRRKMVAKDLEISERTLYRKLIEHQL
jgi:transcriptional regulator with PAS, ATPase and Fis domain